MVAKPTVDEEPCTVRTLLRLLPFPILRCSDLSARVRSTAGVGGWEMQQQRDLESMQVKTELRRETNWVGAFVIGLAGTILVTGVTGPVDAGLGAMAVPVFFATAVMGVLLCFFLAELAAMFPERTGGSPTYA